MILKLILILEALTTVTVQMTGKALEDTSSEMSQCHIIGKFMFRANFVAVKTDITQRAIDKWAGIFKVFWKTTIRTY